MAIFGQNTFWNGTLIYQATTMDKVLDYVFLVISIAMLITSCACNPIVFWFHRKMKQNTPAILFQILTANDFLTCLLVVPVMVYYLVAGKPIDWANPEKVHPWQVYYTIIKGTMFCWSFSLTAILGTVRCIVINFPFVQINKALVLSIAVGTALFTVGLSIGMYLEDKQVWSSYCLQNFPMTYMTNTQDSVTFIVLYTKATCNMVVSLSSAALSVWGLRRADKMKNTSANESKRGVKEAAITLVYLNILIGLQFLLMVLMLVVKQKFPDQGTLMNYISFLTYPFSNTLISAVNPIIYIMRCDKIRQGLLKRSTPSQSRSGNTTLSDANN